MRNTIFLQVEEIHRITCRSWINFRRKKITADRIFERHWPVRRELLALIPPINTSMVTWFQHLIDITISSLLMKIRGAGSKFVLSIDTGITLERPTARLGKF